MNPKEQHELYEKARTRVIQKKYVYYHFVIFLIGSVFLIVLNTVFNVGESWGEWFKYAVALWLFIWLFHFFKIFVTNKFFNKEWEQSETEKLIAKHTKKVEKLEKEFLKNNDITSQKKSESPDTIEKKNPID